MGNLLVINEMKADSGAAKKSKVIFLFGVSWMVLFMEMQVVWKRQKFFKSSVQLNFFSQKCQKNDDKFSIAAI